jgi:hypothetical protein
MKLLCHLSLVYCSCHCLMLLHQGLRSDLRDVVALVYEHGIETSLAEYSALSPSERLAKHLDGVGEVCDWTRALLYNTESYVQLMAVQCMGVQ